MDQADGSAAYELGKRHVISFGREVILSGCPKIHHFSLAHRVDKNIARDNVDFQEYNTSTMCKA